MKRSKLKPGSTTSYRLPQMKGQEGKEFYRWLNSKESVNGAITDALKLKFMIEKINFKQLADENTVDDPEKIADINEIDIFDNQKETEDNMDILMRVINSVKR